MESGLASTANCTEWPLPAAPPSTVPPVGLKVVINADPRCGVSARHGSTLECLNHDSASLGKQRWPSLNRNTGMYVSKSCANSPHAVAIRRMTHPSANCKHPNWSGSSAHDSTSNNDRDAALGAGAQHRLGAACKPPED